MLRSTILIIAIIASGLLAQVPANITGADMREAAASSRAATEVPRMSNPPADSSVVVEAMPRIITFIKARYPDNLKGKGIAGPVVLDLLISEKGTVDSAAVVKGLSPALDSSALLALRSSVFSPAMVGGKPTAVLLRYAYRFLPEDAIDLNVRREDSAMGGKRGSPENASDASGLTARLEGALRYDIGPGELGSVAGFDGDGIKSLQAFPAIGRPFIAGYNFSARGSDYGDTKFLVDGIKLPSLIHNVASFRIPPRRSVQRSILTTDALESATLNPGGWGAQFGDALGGVVEVTTRPARSDKCHGIISGELMRDAGLLIETPLWKNAGVIGSLRGNFLFDEIGFFSRHVGGKTKDPVQDVWDHSLRFDWQITPAHQVTLATIGAKDTQYCFTSSYGQNLGKFDPRHELFSSGRGMIRGVAVWNWAVSPKMRNILTYAVCVSASENLSNYAEQQHLYFSDAKATRHDVRDEFTFKACDGLRFAAGFDIRGEPYSKRESLHSHDTVLAESFETSFDALAVYMLCEWKPTEELTLSPGLRYDSYSHLDYCGSWLPQFWNYGRRFITTQTHYSGDPSLRISASYALDEGQCVTASAGSYNQNPESFIREYKEEKGLTAEKGSHYALGYKRKLNSHFSFDFSGYFGTQWNKARFKCSRELQADSSAKVIANGKARMEGMELLLRRIPTEHFSGWLGYSISRSVRFDYGRGRWVEYDYGTLNNVQVVANWHLKKKQSLGLRFHYTEGFPVSPQADPRYDVSSLQYVPADGPAGAGRLGDYFGLDLRYEKKINVKYGLFTIAFEMQRIVHFLRAIEKSNGKPLYDSGDWILYNDDHSTFRIYPLLPLAALGVAWEF